MMIPVAELMTAVRDSVRYKDPVSFHDLVASVANQFDIPRQDLYHAYMNEMQVNPEFWALTRQLPLVRIGGWVSGKRQGEVAASPTQTQYETTGAMNAK